MQYSDQTEKNYGAYLYFIRTNLQKFVESDLLNQKFFIHYI